MSPREESTDQSQRDWGVLVFLGIWFGSMVLGVAIELYQPGSLKSAYAGFMIFLTDPWLWPFLGVFALIISVAGLLIARRQRQSLHDELEERFDPEAIEMSDETREALVEEYGSVRKALFAFHEEIQDLETPEEIEEWVEEHDLE